MKATRTIQGLLLAFGAPLGWLAIRWLDGIAPWDELAANPLLYLYLTLTTTLTLAAFGCVLGTHEDRLEQLVERLNKQTITDPLTGLRNRRYFFDRLEELRERTTRVARPFAVAILDLDHFKQLNDRLGHLVGDRVLFETAKLLASRARRSELVARIGGEEFGLLFPDADGRDAVAAVERVRRALEGRIGRAAELPDTLRVTASAGVVCSSRLPSGAGPSQLMGAADEALYRAKNGGRNRTVAWICHTQDRVVQRA